MGSADVKSFWLSIIEEPEVLGQLSRVMSVEDEVERALQLTFRTHFLLAMGLKNERDEARKALEYLKENVNICFTCKREKCTEGKEKKTEQEKKAKGKVYDSDLDDNNTDTPGIIINTQHTITPEEPAGQSKIDEKTEKLQQEQMDMSNTIFTDEEDEAETCKVLAPETVSLDDNALYVNVAKRKALATQTVCVPETIPLDPPTTSQTTYGDTDFYSCCSDEEMPRRLLPAERMVRTPEKFPEDRDETQLTPSPVLGKQNHVESPVALKVPLEDRLPRTAEPDPPNVANKTGKNTCRTATETPDPVKKTKKNGTKKMLEGDSGVDKDFISKLGRKPKDTVQKATTSEAQATKPGYSPLLFTHDVSTFLDDSDPTSPSLLHGVHSRNPHTSPVASRSTDPLLKKLSPLSRKKSKWEKCASALKASPPRAANTRSFRRHQTISGPKPEPLYQMTFTVGEAQKKSYKQTKISDCIFQKKTSTNVAKLTGGVPSKDFVLQDEDADFNTAIKMSLRTAADDFKRRNEKELVQKGGSSPSKQRTASSKSSTTPNKNHKSSPSKENEESPIKLPNLDPEPRRSPRKGVHQGKRSSPFKRPRTEEQERVGRKPEKRKKQEDDNMSLSELMVHIERLPDGAGAAGGKKEEEVRQDEVLGRTEGSPGHRKQLGSYGIKHKKVKRAVLEDSFDMLPQEEVEEPQFAYQGAVVRGRARKQLQGWECRECEEWYRNHGHNTPEIRRMMNKCSRHRSKHRPVTSTPPGFWDPEFKDDDLC